MSDQDFDPCECVSPHEVAMRRLLALLRQSQSYCTDIECYQNVTTPRSTPGQNFIFTCIVLMFALFVFFYRTPIARNNFEPTKSRRNENENNGAPPSPPPSS